MQSRSRFAVRLLAVIITLVSSLADAQGWPSRPITLVVPFGAGGSVDIPARRLAADLTQKLGQQVIVENRSGANGNIGGAYVAKSNPDGYTLMFSPPGPLATNRFMYKNMPFDSDRAFAPIILLAKSPLVLVTHPKVPVNRSSRPDRVCESQSGQALHRHAGCRLAGASDDGTAAEEQRHPR